MKEYSIAFMPGDFGGRETTTQGMKVLKATAERFGFSLNVTEFPHGGTHYLKTGEVLPDSVIEEFKQHDAIYKGGIGHPDVNPGIVEKGIILNARFALDQYINLRPSKLYPGVQADIRKIHPELPDGFSVTVIRENCGDLYKGIGGVRLLPDGITKQYYQDMAYTEPEMRRLFAWAFEYATRQGEEKNNIQRLSFLHKGNVVTHVFDPMRAIYKEFVDQFRGKVQASDQYVDAFNGPGIVGNPQVYDIVVTTNMFGDIITDLTAQLFGGMGVGYSGNINPRGVSMFEPIAGSSPKDAGKHVLSPIAAILTGRLMLDYLGEKPAACALETAVEKVLAAGKIPNLTIASGVPTEKQTEYVLEELAQLPA